MDAMKLLFPDICVGCGGSADHGRYRDLCDRCSHALVVLDSDVCPMCALPGPDQDRCVGCLLDPPPFAGSTSALEFSGVVADVVRRAKYAPDLTSWRAVVSWAAETTSKAVSSAVEQGFTPTWVPMARRAARDRGFDPPAIALEWLGFRPVPLLHRQPSERKQANISAPSRLDAARAAFSAVGPVPLNVCIVDDVMTTGATLRACTEALLAAGTSTVVCVTIARTPGPGG